MELFNGLVGQLDRLVARWEVSRLSVVPFAATVLLFWPTMLVIKLIAVATGTDLVVLARATLAVWLAMLGIELTRRLWTARHRYASPRWLRAVQTGVGDDVAVHALAELMGCHRHDRDYVVIWSDMIDAVRAERVRRRNAQRRAEGFRLVEEPTPVPEQPAAPFLESPRISDEQRARARERRAARRERAAS